MKKRELGLPAKKIAEKAGSCCGENLMARARQGLETGEFRLYIQPQADTYTGRIAGGEALARWHRAGQGVIAPDRFIPAFEQSHFITEFDFYMLDQLCRYLQKWIGRGDAPVPISINQSRRHLQNSGYLDRFCAVVDSYRIPHRCIAFELTETAFVECGRQMLELAQGLHQRGFQLAMDDFGTGYSSLSCLSMVKADILKLDRSLVATCGSDRGRVILRKVIEMAKETGMTSVCEGVETAEQWELMKELGCDMIQGFYFYRPMPAEKFEAELLRAAPGGGRGTS